MSIKALVVNANDQPSQNAKVYFKWAFGQSVVDSDSNGIADSGREDTLVSISAYGRTYVEFSKGQFFRDAIFKIKI